MPRRQGRDAPCLYLMWLLSKQTFMCLGVSANSATPSVSPVSSFLHCTCCLMTDCSFSLWRLLQPPGVGSGLARHSSDLLSPLGCPSVFATTHWEASSPSPRCAHTGLCTLVIALHEGSAELVRQGGDSTHGFFLMPGNKH